MRAVSAPEAGPGEGSGDVSRTAPTDATSSSISRIELAANWDVALSYDILDLPRDGHVPRARARPVFVGRRELLGPLVNAIADHDRRGTYLISGYRGAGKTSLLIEAARRAKDELEPDRHLLPIVLNVSEVSASLDSSVAVSPRTLSVDARRLLTAMLRALHSALPDIKAVTADHAADADKLERRITLGYRKAGAAQYTERQRSNVASSRSTETTVTRAFQSPDVLRAIAAVAAVAAIILVGWAAARSALGVVVGAIGGLAGVAVISYARSRSVSNKSAVDEVEEQDITFDNSLHRLEGDLKDILAGLHRLGLRTIVVLEELDKLPDDAGDQLDRVIRYFKNLFTQAPALFFFLTDKEYYDYVARKIAEARSRKTYALEHTFFTTRLFVRRPSAEDCIDYLDAVFVGPEAHEIVSLVRDTDGSLRTRPLAEMTSLGEQFVRALLFMAQDHVFDLKNEIRRYVRVADDGTSWVEFNTTSFRPNEQARATLQFLLEQKIRSYRFGGGRDYADEVLRDCLSAVFADLDSTVEREVAHYYPRPGSEGDELTPGVQRQIRSAVDSLVRDLVTGGAVEQLSKTVDGVTLSVVVWREDGAAMFRPPANLEPHELELVRHLTLLTADLGTLFDYNGRFQDTVALAEVATQGRTLRGELAGRTESFGEASVAMTAETAAEQTRRADRDVADLMARAASVLRSRLEQVYGMSLDAANPDASASLWSVPAKAATLGSGAAGQVLVVFGTDPERRSEALYALRAGLTPSRLVALVVVDTAPSGSFRSGADRGAWERELEALAPSAPLLRWVAIDQGLPTSIRSGREPSPDVWGRRLAEEILYAALWTQAEERLPGSVSDPPGPVWRRAGDGSEEEHATLAAAVSRWFDSPDAMLATPGPPVGPHLEQVVTALATSDGLDGPLAIVVPASALAEPVHLFHAYSFARPERVAEIVRGMVADERLVVRIDTGSEPANALPQGTLVVTDQAELAYRWQTGPLSTLRLDADPSVIAPFTPAGDADDARTN